MGSVTISASFGARGDRIGRAVAERLGLALLDRAIPTAVARQLRMSDLSATALDERSPSRWDRIFTRFVSLDPLASPADLFEPVDPFGPVQVLSEPIVSAHDFRLATEKVMRHVADTTGAVMLGRAGMVVLKGRGDVLCVRLDGPLEARIAHVVADGTEEGVARKTQKDVDTAREQYASFFYKVRQDDIRLYHVYIESTAVSVDACIDMIVTAAKARFASVTG